MSCLQTKISESTCDEGRSGYENTRSSGPPRQTNLWAKSARVSALALSSWKRVCIMNGGWISGLILNGDHHLSLERQSTCYKSNQITFIVTSPQHKCLGEWNSYKRAPESANKTIYIWTVHIYRLYRRQCAKYTYIYSVHTVYYKDILSYQYTLYTICTHLHYVHIIYT